MALRTEQTTMGRATDPKEQRRSAKRGRGPTAPVRRAFERPFGPPAVGHTNDHGAQGTREEGTCEGGRRGDFHRRMRWGGRAEGEGVCTYCGRINTRMLGSSGCLAVTRRLLGTIGRAEGRRSTCMIRGFPRAVGWDQQKRRPGVDRRWLRGAPDPREAGARASQSPHNLRGGAKVDIGPAHQSWRRAGAAWGLREGWGRGTARRSPLPPRNGRHCASAAPTAPLWQQ
jgi:hypothetical protein